MHIQLQYPRDKQLLAPLFTYTFSRDYKRGSLTRFHTSNSPSQFQYTSGGNSSYDCFFFFHRVRTWKTKSYSVRERANRHLHFQISISLLQMYQIIV